MSARRFTEKAPLDPAAVVSLPATHPAMAGNRTLFPTTVVDVDAAFAGRLLVSGHNSRKLGKRVEKGRFKGYEIATLTLEERATCAPDCAVRGACYGNSMNWARRHRIGDFDLFADRLAREIDEWLSTAPGLLVRLHVLGDFPSTEYVAMWAKLLARFPNLACFGYTHWCDAQSEEGEAIYGAIAAVKHRNPERFRIRWSTAGKPSFDTAIVIDHVPDEPRIQEGIVCPAQTNATACCATCGLCWEGSAPIAFIKHGMKSFDAAAEAAMPEPEKPSFTDAELIAARPAMFGFALKLSQNKARADDLVQDTIVKALANRDRFDGANLNAWLMTILRNNFYNGYRKTSREVEDGDGAIATTHGTDDRTEERIDATDALAMLDNLDQDKRQVLMGLLDGRSYEDMAAESGVSVGTIKSRVNRAREMLSGLIATPVATDIETDDLVADGTRPIVAIDLPRDARPNSVPTIDIEVRFVDPTTLRVEEAYQRKLTPKSIKLIRKIATEWDWAKFKPPICFRAKSGLFIVDGQHTAIGAATHPDIKRIPILIVPDRSLAQRARAFVAHNTERVGMTVFDIFHAEIAAGVKETTAIARIIKDAGCFVPRCQPTKVKPHVGQIAGVNELARVYRAKDGAEKLRRSLEILRMGDVSPIGSRPLRATRRLLESDVWWMKGVSDEQVGAAIKRIGDIEQSGKKQAGIDDTDIVTAMIKLIGIQVAARRPRVA